LDLILDAEACGPVPSTVIDLSGAQPEVVRVGAGPIDGI
jgi:tRNA A37 threonylcarbamoyladenosine synthetase subunit TsaC/SUA5/YrdC